MIRRFFYILFTLSLFYKAGQCQYSQYTHNVLYHTLLETSQTVDPSRYDDIEGSPYLYNDWLLAEVVGSDGKIYKDLHVNFNGLTHELEMKNDGVVSILIGTTYLKVIVKKEEGTDSFFRGIHPKFGAKLICVLYDGQRIKLIKNFTVRNQVDKVITPMSPAVFESFVSKSTYYLLVDGELSFVRIKKKKIINILGFKSEIEEYLNTEKLVINTEKDFVQLLAHYESSIIR